jgi:hypothetical protein
LIAPLHSVPDAVPHNHAHGLCASNRQIIQLFDCFLAQGFEHKSRWLDTFRRAPNAKPDPNKRLRLDTVEDRLNAPMAAGAAFGANPNASKRQVEIVVNNNQIGGLSVKLSEQGLHAFAAPIHIGLRFGQKYWLGAEPAPADQRGTDAFGQCNAKLLRDLIDDPKPNVIPRALVFGSGIAESNDQLHWSIPDYDRATA